MRIIDHYEDFYASHNHMPGSDRELRVTGCVVFRTSGCSAALREHEGNPGINPELLVLDLALTPPDGPSADALTPVRVDWCKTDPQIEYRQVEFRVVGTDDEPPPVIDVEHPQ